MLEKLKVHKTKAIAAVATVGTSILPASVAEVTGNLFDVCPIIKNAAGIMPYVLALVISVAGVIISMVVIRFVTELFDSILPGHEVQVRVPLPLPLLSRGSLYKDPLSP